MLKARHILGLIVMLSAGCGGDTSRETSSREAQIAIANGFIDAFYSFDRDSLETVLANAQSSQPNILYYQKWAQCGHYKVITRHDCIVKNDSLVVCPVTVKDDLMSGLEIDFNVTDTFHLAITNGQIQSITNSSNDPAVYYEAKHWVKQNHPELIEQPCEGIWNGGPTPCECIEGMIAGFKDFVKEHKP
jgi:hypothetical protein